MKSNLAIWLIIGLGAGGLLWLNDRNTTPATAQPLDESSPQQPQGRPVSAPTAGTKENSADSPHAKVEQIQGTAPQDDSKELETQEDNEGGYVGRVLGEHFSSHPSTQKRLLHLRGLSQSSQNKKPTAKSKEGIDLLIDVKNRLARASSEVMAEVTGPLSVKDEWAIGSKVHKQLIESLEVDEQASQRLTTLAALLLKQLKRTKDMPYHFTVVKGKTVNAFAHLGGHVYVYNGLMELFENDQQLMFVLGHEIGHIELQQCAKASLPGIAAERIVGSLGKLPVDLMNKLVLLSYSEENELDADVWSYRRLKELNQDDEQIFAFFKVMLDYEREQKAESSKSGNSEQKTTSRSS